MAVPKFRTSKSKRNLRRSHHALKPKSVGYCPACGEAKLPHTLCNACGSYKGKIVAAPKAKSDFAGEDFAVDE